MATDKTTGLPIATKAPTKPLQTYEAATAQLKSLGLEAPSDGMIFHAMSKKPDQVSAYYATSAGKGLVPDPQNLAITTVEELRDAIHSTYGPMFNLTTEQARDALKAGGTVAQVMARADKFINVGASTKPISSRPKTQVQQAKELFANYFPGQEPTEAVLSWMTSKTPAEIQAAFGKDLRSQILVDDANYVLESRSEVAAQFEALTGQRPTDKQIDKLLNKTQGGFYDEVNKMVNSGVKDGNGNRLQFTSAAAARGAGSTGNAPSETSSAITGSGSPGEGVLFAPNGAALRPGQNGYEQLYEQLYGTRPGQQSGGAGQAESGAPGQGGISGNNTNTDVFGGPPSNRNEAISSPRTADVLGNMAKVAGAYNDLVTTYADAARGDLADYRSALSQAQQAASASLGNLTAANAADRAALGNLAGMYQGQMLQDRAGFQNLSNTALDIGAQDRSRFAALSDSAMQNAMAGQNMMLERAGEASAIGNAGMQNMLQLSGDALARGQAGQDALGRMGTQAVNTGYQGLGELRSAGQEAMNVGRDGMGNLLAQSQRAYQQGMRAQAGMLARAGRAEAMGLEDRGQAMSLLSGAKAQGDQLYGQAQGQLSRAEAGAEQQTQMAQDQMGLATDFTQRMQTLFQPVEDSLVLESMGYFDINPDQRQAFSENLRQRSLAAGMTEEQVAARLGSADVYADARNAAMQRAADMAQQDVRASADQARAQTARQLQAYGVDPTSGRFASGIQGMDAQRAATEALAANQARNAAQQLGFSQRAQTAALGAALPQNILAAQQAASSNFNAAQQLRANALQNAANIGSTYQGIYGNMLNQANSFGQQGNQLAGQLAGQGYGLGMQGAELSGNLANQGFGLGMQGQSVGGQLIGQGYGLANQGLATGGQLTGQGFNLGLQGNQQATSAAGQGFGLGLQGNQQAGNLTNQGFALGQQGTQLAGSLTGQANQAGMGALSTSGGLLGQANQALNTGTSTLSGLTGQANQIAQTGAVNQNNLIGALPAYSGQAMNANIGVFNTLSAGLGNVANTYGDIANVNNKLAAAAEAANQSSSSGLGAGIGQIVGLAAGTAIGGPTGGALGSQLGSSLGNTVSGGK